MRVRSSISEHDQHWPKSPPSILVFNKQDMSMASGCISWVAFLFCVPVESSQNFRKDVPTPSIGSIGYTVCTVTGMRGCTEVTDSHSWQSLLSCRGFSNGLWEANKLQIVAFFWEKSHPESASLQHRWWITKCQAKHKKASQEPSSLRRTWREAVKSDAETIWFRMSASAFFWECGRCSEIRFSLRLLLEVLLLYTCITCMTQKSERKSFRERHEFGVIQLFAMLCSSPLQTQFLPDHLGCDQNLVAQLWSQTLLSKKVRP